MTNTTEIIEKAVAQAITESDNRNHENLCHCRSWPESCVTYGTQRPWSHDAEEVARAAVAAVLPSFPREVWGVQVGTWPPEKMQSEEQARWYAEQPAYQGKAYPVHVVKGTAYSVDWQIVDTIQDGE